MIKRTLREMMRLLGAVVCTAALLGVSGCATGGSGKDAVVVIGRGRTLAGTTFTVTRRPTSRSVIGINNQQCSLPIYIAEKGSSTNVEVCYGQSRLSAQPQVQCLAGLLRIHTVMQTAARAARLTLSNGHQATVHTMRVPRRMGGFTTIYYEAMRGPRPIPLRLAELDKMHRVIGEMALPTTYECNHNAVEPIRGTKRLLATVDAPHDKKINITGKTVREAGMTVREFRLAFAGGSGFIFIGPLRAGLPLEWQVARVCRPEYGIVFGLLNSPRDHAYVRSASGVLYEMRETRAPMQGDSGARLVYSVVSHPAALLVRGPHKKVIMRKALGRQFAMAGCPVF